MHAYKIEGEFLPLSVLPPKDIDNRTFLNLNPLIPSVCHED